MRSRTLLLLRELCIIQTTGLRSSWIHLMREGDRKLSVTELIEKYPFRKAREVFLKGGS